MPSYEIYAKCSLESLKAPREENLFAVKYPERGISKNTLK